MLRPLSLACVSLLAFTGSARAQCGGWTDGFAIPGVNMNVAASVVYDDGNGPQLYVGGSFTEASGLPVNRLARWDGVLDWSDVGGGVANIGFTSVFVRALAVYDDGSGPALFAGGFFSSAGGVPASNVAKWNGTTWSALGSGTNLSVESFFAFDDGSGTKLYVGGNFTQAGGQPAGLIATWDGSTWSAVGAGLADTSPQGYVNDMVAFDEGSGTRLFAGGHFDMLGGGQPATSMARWDGSSWSTVGTMSIGTNVLALLVHDDGSGNALYAGGQIHEADGLPIPGIARWDGTSWSRVGAPNPDRVDSLIEFDLGAGPRLLAGVLGGLQQWDGVAWSTVGETFNGPYYNSPLSTLCIFQNPSGGPPRLFGAGSFDSTLPSHTPMRNVARLVGDDWKALGSDDGLDAEVETLFATETGPDGPALYAGGLFRGGSNESLSAIARWDGSSWNPLGPGLTYSPPTSGISVLAMTIHDDGSGPALYAGGTFNRAGAAVIDHVGRWNGNNWTPLGYGLNGAVRALAVFDDGSGPALYAGGEFTLSGATPIARIAKWDGTDWQQVSSGTPGPSVIALAVHDDGFGPALYAAGNFLSIGGTAAKRIARWNGAFWSELTAAGLDARGTSLAVYDSGSGPQLYVGGQFQHAGGNLAPYIARWDGASWSSVGGGMDHFVLGTTVYDDGSGPALVAAGRFEHAGGVDVQRVAKWDGASWTGLGVVDAAVNAVAVYDDPTTPWRELFAGGRFDHADGKLASNVARYANACACTATSYCTSGTTSSGCVTWISGIGTPSASQTSGFTIRIDGVEGQKQGHIFYGVNGALANPWSPLSSSYLCVKAPTQRTPTQNSNGTNGACNGAIQIDWLDYVATHPGSLGAPFAAGTRVWAQLYFRDPPAPKTTNLSDGLTFLVCP